MKTVPSVLDLLPLASSFRLIPGSQYVFHLERYLLESLFRWAQVPIDKSSPTLNSPKKNLQRLETAARDLQTLLGSDDLKDLSSTETIAAVKNEIAGIEAVLTAERGQRTTAERQQYEMEPIEAEFHRNGQQIKILEERLLACHQQFENLKAVRRRTQILKQLKKALIKLSKRSTATGATGDEIDDASQSNGKGAESDSSQ